MDPQNMFDNSGFGSPEYLYTEEPSYRTSNTPLDRGNGVPVQTVPGGLPPGYGGVAAQPSAAEQAKAAAEAAEAARPKMRVLLNPGETVDAKGRIVPITSLHTDPRATAPQEGTESHALDFPDLPDDLAGFFGGKVFNKNEGTKTTEAAAAPEKAKSEKQKPPRDVILKDGSRVRQFSDGSLIVLASTQPYYKNYLQKPLTSTDGNAKIRQVWNAITVEIGPYVSPGKVAVQQAIQQAAPLIQSAAAALAAKKAPKAPPKFQPSVHSKPPEELPMRAQEALLEAKKEPESPLSALNAVPWWGWGLVAVGVGGLGFLWYRAVRARDAAQDALNARGGSAGGDDEGAE